LREGASLLERAGIEDARRNAELLLQKVIGAERVDLLANPDRIARPSHTSAYRDLLQKRAAHFPLQYLVGRVGFMDFELNVDSRVLIPRPETELLAETAIEFITARPFTAKTQRTQRTATDWGNNGNGQNNGKKDGKGGLIEETPVVICDVGTGSGCIAIALARAIPSAKIFATDISRDALDLAAENARACGVADRIAFLEGDLLEPICEMKGRLDAICSNPPYVSPEEFDRLEPEIREHEPRRALVAAEDGLEFHRRLIESAPVFLKEGGWLIVELPAGRRARIEALLATAAGIRGRRVVRDYAGIDRVLVAQRVRR
jgi:release factor glutamine methyltransferase